VWQQAVGSEDSNVSAYFLIYVSKEMALAAREPTDYSKLIPEFVCTCVDDENKEFLADLES